MNAGRRMDELVTEALDRLDRIEQILREMGHCDRCHQAHLKGIADCIDNGLTRVERSMDALLDEMQPRPRPPASPWWKLW